MFSPEQVYIHKNPDRIAAAHEVGRLYATRSSGFHHPDNRQRAVAQLKKKEEDERTAPAQLQDNRAKTVAQRKQQEQEERTGPVQLQDNRPRSVVQRKLAEQEPVQRKTNTGLPTPLKSGIENLSGYSMDDVKVHYNSSQPAQLNAHAYAQGNQIHVAPGQEKHLPHEAWHVVQQKQGRVKATAQLKGKTKINDDAGLEKEADIMGNKAAFHVIQKKTASGLITRPAPIYDLNTPVQRLPLVGNLVTDIMAGTALTIVSNASWLIGQQETKQFSPVLTGVGFGTGMYAVLKGYPIKGGSSADNAPDNAAWDALRSKKTRTGSTFYVRAHLLRDKFGGPASWDNLVPLTNAGNNVGGSPISHFHAVERPIEQALRNKKTVGYRVVPVYGGVPLLKTPTSIVSSILGFLPLPWYRDLLNILYYENYVPSAITTSWWYQDDWLAAPSMRVIRNWAPFDASIRFTIRGRELSYGEWAILGISEILKAAIAYGWPAGTAWTGLLGYIGSFGMNLPSYISTLRLDTVMAWFDYVDSHYGAVARVLGNFGSRDVDKEYRRHFPVMAGVIPTVGESVAVASAAITAVNNYRGAGT